MISNHKEIHRYRKQGEIRYQRISSNVQVLILHFILRVTDFSYFDHKSQVEILDIGRVRESGSDTQGRHEFKRTNKVHTQATIIIKVFTTRDLPRP